MVLLGTGGLALAAKHGGKPTKHGTAPRGRLSITKQSWGTANGQAVDLYTLRNSHGVIVKISSSDGPTTSPR